MFRFPRSEIAVDLLRAESQVLPIIAPQLPLSVPVPEYLGQPTERFPRPFAGYRMLPGRTACRVRLDEVARAGLIPDARPWLELLTQLPDSCQPGNGG